MRAALRTEYVKLIRDTRGFIQKFLPSPELPPQHEAAVVKTVVKKSALPSTEQVAAPHLETTLAPPKKEMPKTSAWELHPMPPPMSETSLKQKLAAFIPTAEPHIPVLLVLAEENPIHRLFLENVSRAITRAFTPACVIMYRETIFRDYLRGCLKHIFFIPHQLLKKSSSIHQPFARESSTIVPLENIDLYIRDGNTKRALWNTIQLLFRS